MTSKPVGKAIAVLTAILILIDPPLRAGVEANFWAERHRLNTMQARPVQLASLPGESFSLPVMPALLSHRLDATERFLNLPSGTGGLFRDALASVPATAGSVKEVHLPAAPAPGMAGVIVIQDIHQNAEAQLNIAAVVSALNAHLSGRSGTPLLLGVEAAFGSFDFSWFRAFPDKKLLSDAARYFLDQGKIAAPSYVGLTSGIAPPLTVGIDDEAEYRENVAAYRASDERRAGVRKEVSKISADIAAEKNRILNPALKAFDDVNGSFERGSLSLGVYLSKLKGFDAGESPGGPAEKAIDDFLTAYAMEQTIDFDRAASERTRVLEAVSQRAGKPELEAAVRDALAYKSGELSLSGYNKRFCAFLVRNGVALGRYPMFEKYTRYVSASDAIDANALFDAIHRLEKKLTEHLSKNETERRLMAAGRRALLTDRMLDSALSPQEWIEYQKLAALPELAPRFEALVHGRLLPFETFYRAADRRSGKMAEHLVAAAKANGGRSPVAVIVGGFHTPLLVQALNDRGAIVAVVQPRVTKIEGAGAASYLSAFTREKAPLDRLFAGERLFLGLRATALGRPGELVGPQFAAVVDAIASLQKTAARMPGVIVGQADRGVRSLALPGLKLLLKFMGSAQPVAEPWQKVGDPIEIRDYPGVQFVASREGASAGFAQALVAVVLAPVSALMDIFTNLRSRQGVRRAGSLTLGSTYAWGRFFFLAVLPATAVLLLALQLQGLPLLPGGHSSNALMWILNAAGHILASAWAMPAQMKIYASAAAVFLSAALAILSPINRVDRLTEIAFSGFWEAPLLLFPGRFLRAHYGGVDPALANGSDMDIYFRRKAGTDSTLVFSVGGAVAGIIIFMLIFQGLPVPVTSVGNMILNHLSNAAMGWLLIGGLRHSGYNIRNPDAALTIEQRKVMAFIDAIGSDKYAFSYYSSVYNSKSAISKTGSVDWVRAVEGAFNANWGKSLVSQTGVPKDQLQELVIELVEGHERDSNPFEVARLIALELAPLWKTKPAPVTLKDFVKPYLRLDVGQVKAKILRDAAPAEPQVIASVQAVSGGPVSVPSVAAPMAGPVRIDQSQAPADVVASPPAKAVAVPMAPAPAAVAPAAALKRKVPAAYSRVYSDQERDRIFDGFKNDVFIPDAKILFGPDENSYKRAALAAVDRVNDGQHSDSDIKTFLEANPVPEQQLRIDFLRAYLKVRKEGGAVKDWEAYKVWYGDQLSAAAMALAGAWARIESGDGSAEIKEDSAKPWQSPDDVTRALLKHLEERGARLHPGYEPLLQKLDPLWKPALATPKQMPPLGLALDYYRNLAYDNGKSFEAFSHFILILNSCLLLARSLGLTDADIEKKLQENRNFNPFENIEKSVAKRDEVVWNILVSIFGSATDSLVTSDLPAAGVNVSVMATDAKPIVLRMAGADPADAVKKSLREKITSAATAASAPAGPAVSKTAAVAAAAPAPKRDAPRSAEPSVRTVVRDAFAVGKADEYISGNESIPADASADFLRFYALAHAANLRYSTFQLLFRYVMAQGPEAIKQFETVLGAFALPENHPEWAIFEVLFERVKQGRALDAAAAQFAFDMQYYTDHKGFGPTSIRDAAQHREREIADAFMGIELSPDVRVKRLVADYVRLDALAARWGVSPDAFRMYFRNYFTTNLSLTDGYPARIKEVERVLPTWNATFMTDAVSAWDKPDDVQRIVNIDRNHQELDDLVQAVLAYRDLRTELFSQWPRRDDEEGFALSFRDGYFSRTKTPGEAGARAAILERIEFVRNFGKTQPPMIHPWTEGVMIGLAGLLNVLFGIHWVPSTNWFRWAAVLSPFETGALLLAPEWFARTHPIGAADMEEAVQWAKGVRRWALGIGVGAAVLAVFSGATLTLVFGGDLSTAIRSLIFVGNTVLVGGVIAPVLFWHAERDFAPNATVPDPAEVAARVRQAERFLRAGSENRRLLRAYRVIANSSADSDNPDSIAAAIMARAAIDPGAVREAFLNVSPGVESLNLAGLDHRLVSGYVNAGAAVNLAENGPLMQSLRDVERDPSLAPVLYSILMSRGAVPAAILPADARIESAFLRMRFADPQRDLIDEVNTTLDGIGADGRALLFVSDSVSAPNVAAARLRFANSPVRIVTIPANGGIDLSPQGIRAYIQDDRWTPVLAEIRVSRRAALSREILDQLALWESSSNTIPTQMEVFDILMNNEIFLQPATVRMLSDMMSMQRKVLDLVAESA